MRLLATTGTARFPLCRRAFSTTSKRCLRPSALSLLERTPKEKPLANVKDRLPVDSKYQDHDPKARLRQDMTRKYGSRHEQFRRAVLSRFAKVLEEIETQDFSVSGIGPDELKKHAVEFMNSLDEAFLLAEQNITRRDKNPLFWNLRDAFVRHDAKGITGEVRYAFQSFMVRNRFTKELEDNQQRLLDMRFPQEWFPGTREMQRTIHVHVGPTNSGKTYNAIKALENSKSGVYAGPLRLLATEVYQRLTAKGRPCALLTGEEVRMPEDTDQYYTSCTVEMMPLNSRFDVAVIDEIQMLGDADRGNAWTTALLGVRAKEVHVCGEERAVNLVKTICASIGDKCVVHRYERLSPLETMNKSVNNDYSKLRKGDAIVAFSRLSLHALKRKIESHTGRRCAIVYGSLPPEVRVQQAALFNDPDNDYDFIVASDAIGMGLNLEIRRVILDAVNKYDGIRDRPLTYPEIKQIGGRAGRYRTAANPGGKGGKEANVGYVTTMESADLQNVQKAFKRNIHDLKAAYITPPAGIIERFASYYPPATPLSFILMRIRTAAVLGNQYKMTITADSLQIADLIQDLPLSIYDRLTLCYLPVSLNTKASVETLRALAKIIAENGVGDLLSIKEIPLEYLEIDMSDTKGHGQEYLAKMEALHVAINQYVWLSYRYAGMFRNQGLAFHIRSLVEQRLIQLLDRLDFTDKDLERRRQRERNRARMLQVSLDSLGQVSDQDEPHELSIDDEPISEGGDMKLLELVESTRQVTQPQEAGS